MPSTQPVPGASDYVQAFHRSIRARRDNRADGHSGSAYDYLAGTSAMLMARESRHLRDLFRADYFSDAMGDDLTNLVATRFNIQRITDTYGPGTATLARPVARSLGDNTIWEGTRIKVGAPGVFGRYYAVAKDTPVPAAAAYVAGIPIRATTYGAGTAIDTTTGGMSCSLDDPIYDPTWTVTSLRCADGTVYEKAADFRARVRTTLAQNIVGYEPGIAAALATLGAANVTVFGTNTGGTDLHACACYVGDASFNGSAALVQASDLLLESWRMLGAYMVVGPMVSTPLTIAATVTLYDDPSRFALDTLQLSCAGAVTRAFSDSASYGYDLDALFGALVGVSDAIQDCEFATPSSSQGLLVGSPPFFPAALPRYYIPSSGIALSFVGPNN